MPHIPVELPFIADIGSTGLVILFVIAILTGRLRPQSSVREIREDRDARVLEARDRYAEVLKVAKVWEEAYRATEEARKDQAKVLDDLFATVKAMRYAGGPTLGGEPNNVEEEERGENNEH